MLFRLSLSGTLGCAVAVSALLFAPATPAAEPAPSVAQAPASPGDALLGVWKPADMEAEVQISANNGQYVGGVVKAANPAMVNTMMLRGITYDAASGSWKGEIFALKRGMFVPMTIRMTPAGFEMVAGSGIMSKTLEWVRVQ